MAGGTADQGAQARQHLLHVEGLGDIIVGPRIEPHHLVGPSITRRKDEHRHHPAGAPPAVEHGDAVELGQADVEDHGIIRFGIAEEVAFLAVKSAVNGIAGIFKRLDDLPVEVLIVLYHEKPHGISYFTPTTSPVWALIVTLMTRPSGPRNVTT